MKNHLGNIKICIKGAGEMASGIAWRLHRARFRNLLMVETEQPLAVRRTVSFCEAVYNGRQVIQNISAQRTESMEMVRQAWDQNQIAVRIDPSWHSLKEMNFDVVVDAIIAKHNLGTSKSEAELVIGMGPGFTAGEDVHLVIETHRGHDLGRIISIGMARPNTGQPGRIEGTSWERVLRAPTTGRFESRARIGQKTEIGEVLGQIAGQNVHAAIDGVLRGLLRSGTHVPKGLKLGDIDPRGRRAYCNTISDKARALGGSVLEAILHRYNRET